MNSIRKQSTLRRGIHPCCSGLQVQGAAISPAGMAYFHSRRTATGLLYHTFGTFSREFTKIQRNFTFGGGGLRDILKIVGISTTFLRLPPRAGRRENHLRRRSFSLLPCTPPPTPWLGMAIKEVVICSRGFAKIQRNFTFGGRGIEGYFENCLDIDNFLAASAARGEEGEPSQTPKFLPPPLHPATHSLAWYGHQRSCGFSEGEPSQTPKFFPPMHSPLSLAWYGQLCARGKINPIFRSCP